MKIFMLGLMALAGLVAGSLGQVIIDTDFTVSQGYLDGDLAGQQNWAAISTTGVNAFNVSDAVGVGYAETVSTTSHDTVNGNQVYYNQGMANNVNDVWTGSMDFQLSTTPHSAGGGTNAVINHTAVFDLGITASTGNGLSFTDANDVVITGHMRNNAALVIVFSSSNVADRPLAELSPLNMGWSPENVGDINIVDPLKTDPLNLTWTIRKISNSTDEYQVTAILLNKVTGVSGTVASGQTYARGSIHSAEQVYFAMGQSYEAAGPTGTDSLVDLTIKSVGFSKEGNVFPDVFPPENVSAAAGNSEVVLAWDASLEAAGYVVYRKTGWNGSFSSLASVTDNIYTDTWLTNGEGYYYMVAALYDNSPNPDVESAPSVQVGASPSNFESGSVLTDFMVAGGNAGSSIDLTWSTLAGTVTLGSSVAAVPLIDSVQNTMTETDGVSGVIKVNILAVDDLSSSFVPSTWSGGGQSAGNSVNAQDGRGWGVRRDGKTNGDLQGTEALILTFDLSALTLGAGRSVVLKGISFLDVDARNGDVWMRDFDVAEGTAGAGVRLADNVATYSDSLTISDGDQIALMRGAKDTRLTGIELDVIGGDVDPLGDWLESFGLYGESDRDPYGDLDGDNFANLYEYGVDGDPLDPENTGVAPRTTGVVNDGGTHYIEYVYVARYYPAGIVSVHPVSTSNLLLVDWTNANHEVVSSTPIDSEYATVITRIDTLDPVKMIRLKVEEL